MIELKWIFVLILFCLLAPACAYHPGFGDRQIPGGYRSIAVPVFKNNTHEAGVEVFFTNAFIREMQRSKIGLLSDRNSAQVTVEGVVDGISYVPHGVVEAGVTNSKLPSGTALNQTYGVVAASTLRLRRNSDQKILWEGSFSKESSYDTPRIGIEPLTGANALYNHSARYQNIEMLAADMMTEAHDRLTENF
jgi:hypothetical protein